MHTRIRIDTVGMHKKVSEHTPFICSKAFTRSTLSSDKFGLKKEQDISFYNTQLRKQQKIKKTYYLAHIKRSRVVIFARVDIILFFTLTICRFIIRRQLDIIHCYKTKNNKGQSYSVWKKKMQAHWMTPLQPHCNNEMQVKKIVQLKKIMKECWSNNIFIIKFIPVHILLNTKRQTQTNWNIEMNAQWRTLLLGDQREQIEAMSSYSQF